MRVRVALSLGVALSTGHWVHARRPPSTPFLAFPANSINKFLYVSTLKQLKIFKRKYLHIFRVFPARLHRVCYSKNVVVGLRRIRDVEHPMYIILANIMDRYICIRAVKFWQPIPIDNKQVICIISFFLWVYNIRICWRWCCCCSVSFTHKIRVRPAGLIWLVCAVLHIYSKLIRSWREFIYMKTEGA